MKLLRDKRELTKLLLLFELTTGNYSTFKSLAEKFDITIQAISDYFKIMSEEELVKKIDGFYKPTQAGVEFLHNNFSHLRTFVDDGIQKLSIITRTSAIAGNRIEKDDRVGLFMEGGSLYAYSELKSSSSGIAASSASKGQEVGIAELDGIVKLKPGRITIFNLPGMDEGGSKKADLNKLKSTLEKQNPDLIFVKGIIAEVAVKKLDINNSSKFAVVESAVEAASVGLRSVIIASSEYLPELKLGLEKTNQERMNMIEYKVLNH